MTCGRIYTIDEIREIVTPIAKKHSLKAVYLFGSYARGEATAESDVDVLIDRAGSTIKSLFDLGALYNDLTQSIGKSVDIVTLDALEQSPANRSSKIFSTIVKKEARAIYEAVA